MKLRQFQYLAAIQTHGSMAKAAQALFVSQPAISRDIRALEAELGFPILQRSWQGAVFTPQGRQVLEIAQAILGEVEKLRQLAGGSGAAIWGRLALGGTAYFSHSLLLGAVVSLHQRYPQLDIRLEEDHSRAVLDRLHDGSLDLGVILHCNLDQPDFADRLQAYALRATPLFRDEMVFVAGADHPLAQQGSATMEEILQYPLVQYKADVNEGTLQLFRQYRRDPELLYIDDFNSLWRLPQIGPYLFLSPALALGSQDRERLRPVHIRDLDYHGTISWVHSQAPLSPAEQAVVSALEAASARLQQEIG